MGRSEREEPSVGFGCEGGHGGCDPGGIEPGAWWGFQALGALGALGSAGIPGTGGTGISGDSRHCGCSRIGVPGWDLGCVLGMG